MNKLLNIIHCTLIGIFYIHKIECNFINNILFKYSVLNSVKVNELIILRNSITFDNNKSEYYFKANAYDNDTCIVQFTNILESLNKTEEWALKVIDSWGKLPSGMLLGNTFEFGNFDECLSINKYINEKNVILGQYCVANIIFHFSNNSSENEIVSHLHLRKTEENYFLHNNLKMPLPQNDNYSARFEIGIGVCMPATCSTSIISFLIETYILEELLKEYNVTASVSILENTCSIKQEVKLKTLDIIVLIVFLIIVFLMAVSTIYDIIMTKRKRNKNLILLSFSIYTNGKKLLTIKKNKSVDVMECLNGIRVLSIVWILYGHSLFVMNSVPTMNPGYLLEFIVKYYSMLIFAAPISVDTFFVLSGLLIAWSLLRYLDKSKGKLNWKYILWIYLHRYLRLTPPLLAALLFTLTFAKYIGSGPLWNFIIDNVNTNFCTKYWWSTLLYVQNYVNPGNLCFGHSWYLSIDMQLFLISPLILYPLWKWKKRFMPIIIILILASTTYVFITYILNDYTKQILLTNSSVKIIQDAQTYYPTHARIGSWLIGIILGFILHSSKTKFMKMNKLIILFGWTISLGIILAIIFGLYPMFQPNYPLASLESAFYEPFSRIGWSISLSWVIFACVKGYGGPINTLLSLSIWQPLAKLSYSVYILHLVIQVLFISSIRTTEYINGIVGIHRFWGYFGFTITIAIFWSLAFESPVVNLEKILSNLKTPKTNSTLSNEISNNNEKSTM